MVFFVQYTGTWYEAGRYPMSFQSSNGRCTIATYQATDEFTISVNNSEVSTDRFGRTERTVLLGQGEQTYPSTMPNAVKVSFNFNNKFINFFANFFSSFSNKPNYFVYETDYDSYALGKYI